MPSDPKYIRDFKIFASGDLSFPELDAFEQEAYGRNARTTVIMLSAVTEMTLETFLRAKLRPSLNGDDRRRLFDFEGSLGTFGARTVVGYAFNFFGPETRADLDLIRIVRNGFAHSRKPMKFEDQAVSDMCSHLLAADWPGAIIPHSLLERALSKKALVAAVDKTNPRTRFIASCHEVAVRLLDNSDVLGATHRLDLP